MYFEFVIHIIGTLSAETDCIASTKAIVDMGVKVFDDSSYRIHYHNKDDTNNNEQLYV
jgi:hypothetical protein